MTALPKPFFPALTGLRAVAAYMVFLHHANPFNSQGWQRPLHSFVNELHVGVSLFFVLSGFLIYLRYADERLVGSRSIFNYFQNRLARIYPIYFILTTITFLVHLKLGLLDGSYETIFIYLANLTFFKGFFNELKFSGIGQGWSLTVEECFYVFAPILFLIKRSYLIFILPIVLLFMGSVFVYLFQNLNFYGLLHDFNFMMIYTFFGRSFEFIVGVGLAMHLREKDFSAITCNKLTTVAIMTLVLLVATMASLRVEESSGLDHPLDLIINNFILPFAFALLIAGLIIEGSWIQKILSSKIMLVLGKSSYAFYLVHAGVFYSFAHYFSSRWIVIFVMLNLLAMLITTPLNDHCMNDGKLLIEDQRITASLPNILLLFPSALISIR